MSSSQSETKNPVLNSHRSTLGALADFHGARSSLAASTYSICYFQQVGLCRISTDFSKPSCNTVVFICFP